jgi:hypothetical protein
MLNNLKLRKINGKLFTPRYMIPDKEDTDMSREMEEEILKSIGAQAIYYGEVFEEVTENNSPWTQDNEEDFVQSIESLKTKDHINFHDHTTGQERNLFSLTKRGMSRYARLMKREGLI